MNTNTFQSRGSLTYIDPSVVRRERRRNVGEINSAVIHAALLEVDRSSVERVKQEIEREVILYRQDRNKNIRFVCDQLSLRAKTGTTIKIIDLALDEIDESVRADYLRAMQVKKMMAGRPDPWPEKVMIHTSKQLDDYWSGEVSAESIETELELTNKFGRRIADVRKALNKLPPNKLRVYDLLVEPRRRTQKANTQTG